MSKALECELIPLSAGAAMLGVSERTVHRLLKADEGNLPTTIRIGRRRFFRDKRAIREWLDRKAAAVREVG